MLKRGLTPGIERSDEVVGARIGSTYDVVTGMAGIATGFVEGVSKMGRMRLRPSLPTVTDCACGIMDFTRANVDSLGREVISSCTNSILAFFLGD